MTLALAVVSLFSGAGALDLGLERTGHFRTVAFAENNKHASYVLARHWPSVPNLGDVRSVDFTPWAGADMIAAGFPCQDLSCAGLGMGLDGARSGLWSEVRRAVRDIRPRLVFLENVAALLVRGLDEVLGDLAALGYNARWDCLPASYRGAPHNRDRIWIVANAIGSEWRHEQYDGALRRMGRQLKSVPWDRDWQSALRELRRVDDGNAYRVHRVDTIRNSVVVPLVEDIGYAIAAGLGR